MDKNSEERRRIVDPRTGREIVTYRLRDIEACAVHVDREVMADLADLYSLHREWGLFELLHYMEMISELAAARASRMSLRHRPKVGFGSTIM